MKLKPKIRSEILERPYIKGILIGMLIGMGVFYILFSTIIKSSTSILSGLLIFIFGIYIAILEGEKIWELNKK